MQRTLHDLAVLAARLGVGGIFLANGWQKLESGLTATGAQFATFGAPNPGAWAATTMLMELIGGTLLVVGLAVPVCGLLLFCEAVAVFVVARGEHGLPLTDGDVSLIVAIGAASILLAVGGAGRLSIDHMVVIKRREAVAAEDLAVEAEADDIISALREPEAAKAVPAEPIPASAAGKPVRAAGSGRTARTDQADRPAQSTPEDAPGPGGDTAEPPAARPRGGRRSATSKTAAGSAKGGDTLVAGEKDRPAGR
ncbi:DoxX family membrane protein [Streptosporangium sp. NPDC006007]|uniref:DoxX family protein n=1 Tax=Streptosporangium sp. NPDC006007 TaxID=3154575 RepID=UPI0033B26774